MKVELSKREALILREGLDGLCEGDITDYGFDYETEVAPLFVKLDSAMGE